MSDSLVWLNPLYIFTLFFNGQCSCRAFVEFIRSSVQCSLSIFTGAQLRGGSWGLDPCSFPYKGKVHFFLENFEAVLCIFVKWTCI